MAMVRNGSFATEMGSPRHVRFPPIATIERKSLEVRFGPYPDMQANQRCVCPTY